jgi:hypothetical protein
MRATLGYLFLLVDALPVVRHFHPRVEALPPTPALVICARPQDPGDFRPLARTMGFYVLPELFVFLHIPQADGTM